MAGVAQRTTQHAFLYHWLLNGCLLALSACELFDAAYFTDKLNIATQQIVANRYGVPHKTEPLDDGRTAWTYYRRGSITTGYAGSPKDFCKAHILTFDRHGVLRESTERDC